MSELLKEECKILKTNLGLLPIEILTHIIEFIEDYNSSFNFIKINKEIFHLFYNQHPLFSINKINKELQHVLNYSSNLSTKTGFNKVLNKLENDIQNKLKEIKEASFFRETVLEKKNEIKEYINSLSDKPHLQQKLNYLFSILKYKDIAEKVEDIEGEEWNEEEQEMEPIFEYHTLCYFYFNYPQNYFFIQSNEEEFNYIYVSYGKDEDSLSVIGEGNSRILFKKKDEQFIELQRWVEKDIGISMEEFFEFLRKVMYTYKYGLRIMVCSLED
ncbi:hypothetical protein ABK040_013442 [Willaertia magna]